LMMHWHPPGRAWWLPLEWCSSASMNMNGSVGHGCVDFIFYWQTFIRTSTEKCGGRGSGERRWRWAEAEVATEVHGDRVCVSITLFRWPPQSILCLYL
jgi:hypothetical protein